MSATEAFPTRRQVITAQPRVQPRVITASTVPRPAISPACGVRSTTTQLAARTAAMISNSRWVPEPDTRGAASTSRTSASRATTASTDD